VQIFKLFCVSTMQTAVKIDIRFFGMLLSKSMHICLHWNGEDKSGLPIIFSHTYTINVVDYQDGIIKLYLQIFHRISMARL